MKDFIRYLIQKITHVHKINLKTNTVYTRIRFTKKWYMAMFNDDFYPIRYIDSDGYEELYDYDKNNNCIHYKNSFGNEYFKEYDEDGNLIKHESSLGYELKSN